MDNLQGKIALVTGATSGIGKVTALELARMGAHVVLIGRSASKTQATLAEIKAQVPSASLDLLLADLSLMRDVRGLADSFKAKHDHLDILVNNAGGFFSSRQETSEGLEMTFALNHMSYFLLTNLLLDQLKAAPSARIVSVASEASQMGKVDFDDLQLKQGYGMGAYGNSKLMNVMFTYELVRHLAGSVVTANVLHPGFVRTGFGKNVGGLFKVAISAAQMFALSPEQGADTIVYLASSPEVEGITGKYWDKRKPIRSNAQSYNEADQRRLWEASAKIAGL